MGAHFFIVHCAPSRLRKTRTMAMKASYHTVYPMFFIQNPPFIHSFDLKCKENRQSRHARFRTDEIARRNLIYLPLAFV